MATNLGDVFRSKFREISQEPNCGCSDVAALMNRWGLTKTQEKIPRIMDMMRAKVDKAITDEQIEQCVLETLVEFEALLKQSSGKS